ncbi:hypothetical protein EZS27_026278, partial [termite gut metagenome]
LHFPLSNQLERYSMGWVMRIALLNDLFENACFNKRTFNNANFCLKPRLSAGFSKR